MPVRHAQSLVSIPSIESITSLLGRPRNSRAAWRARREATKFHCGSPPAHGWYHNSPAGPLGCGASQPVGSGSAGRPGAVLPAAGRRWRGDHGGSGGGSPGGHTEASQLSHAFGGAPHPGRGGGPHSLRGGARTRKRRARAAEASGGAAPRLRRPGAHPPCRHAPSGTRAQRTRWGRCTESHPCGGRSPSALRCLEGRGLGAGAPAGRCAAGAGGGAGRGGAGRPRTRYGGRTRACSMACTCRSSRSARPSSRARPASLPASAPSVWA